MEICMVSQNPMLVKSIELMLAGDVFGYELTVYDGAAQKRPPVPFLVIVDAQAPVGELKSFRAFQKEHLAGIPVLVVTGAGSSSERPEGFEGAETLSIPFHRGDLLAHLNACRKPSNVPDKAIVIGPLELDMKTRVARVDGKPAPLTAREFDVLEYLAIRKGTTLTKEMFLNHLYGGVDEPEVKIIDVFVCKIRGKLKALTGGDPLIATVWGRGYVLRDPDPASDDVDDTREAG